MLSRQLELELMDTVEDAREYDTMDHAAVNAQFVTDFLNALATHSDWFLQPAASSVESRPVYQVLDLGAGTAQIPIELCRRAANIHVTAIDAADHMLALAQKNVATANLADRITLLHADAKRLTATQSGSRFAKTKFHAVISNSILHHIPEPREVLAEAIRVAGPSALQFHRDLCRPSDEAQVAHLVATYAATATPYQQKLFADSLRAALTLEEMRQLVTEFGFARETVQMNSDRHSTWCTVCDGR